MFGPHDVLFAQAGVVHRFEDFSDDFLVWVFFYVRKAESPTLRTARVA